MNKIKSLFDKSITIKHDSEKIDYIIIRNNKINSIKNIVYLNTQWIEGESIEPIVTLEPGHIPGEGD